MKNDQECIPHSPYIPYDKSVSIYNTAFVHLTPYSFTGFKKESNSWKKSCYLHAGLNPASPYRLSGKDAIRLFKDTCVNTFEVFEIGSTRHAIMCNERGNVMSDGLVLHTAENEFICYFLNPYLNYHVDSGKYDVQGEDLTGKTFLFQVGGPKSFAVLNSILKDSLVSLDFFKHRENQILCDENGYRNVRVLRAGVAGTLAYEVHGDIEDALPVYRAILKAGESVELVRLGLQAYGMNHTENGFYQSFMHFMPAWRQDESFIAYLKGSGDKILSNIFGSAGDDVSKRYSNPIEAGWADRIVFDHDFIGRKALEKYMLQPMRRIVTLVWDAQDITEVYASQFARSQDSFEYMDLAANPIWTHLNSSVHSDDVFIGDTLVGISSGRIFSDYYKYMISLCLINKTVKQGTMVEIIWGAPGSRQKKIRAKVCAFPFLGLIRNKDIDVKYLEC